MRSPWSCEFARLFRLPMDLLVCVIAAVTLIALGRWTLALAVGMGFLVFVFNAFILYWAGRALLHSGSGGRGAALAGLSGMGRMLFLAVALAIAASVGVATFLTCAGSLLFCQMNLHVAYMSRKGRERWTNI
jgi:hypothetical protein